MAKIKPVRHEDQLSLVDHLDELRSRLIYVGVAVVLVFAVCFWQSSFLLDLAARPLPAGDRSLIVLAPTEAFMTTITVSVYAAIVITVPFLSYQLFAYILPAFSPKERRAVYPLLIAIPMLFLVGAVFSFFVVLPAAAKFLLSFNSAQFETQLRAQEYYSFFAMALLAGGIVFELPIVILALVRLRIVTIQQLRHNRRYAWLGISIIAAALPGVDPITMIVQMIPLLILYELSIVLARGIGRPSSSRSDELTIQEH